MDLAFGPFRIDPERRALRSDGADVAVQPLVFDLLVYFLQRPNTLVTRDDLIRDVWKGVIVSDGSIAQAISLLRRLLRDADGSGNPLRTVWGRGYRFDLSAPEDGGTRPTMPDPPKELPFVGRADVLGRFHRTLDEVKRGGARAVLLWGEPGIGKSRTCRELARIASEERVPAFLTQVPEARGAPSFWAWEDLRRQVIAAIGPDGGAIEVATRTSGEEETPADELGDLLLQEREGLRFDMFERVATFWGAVAARGPVVLMIDDVHRADVETLELLAFALDRLAGAPILFVATMRSAEATGDEPMARVVGGLARRPAIATDRLRRLDSSHVRELVAVVRGEPCDEATAADLHERSGGNPLLLGLLLRTPMGYRRPEGGDGDLSDLRWGLGPAIERHLDVVTRDCRDLLTVASVIGREFDGPLLANVAHLDLAEVTARLDEGVEGEIVTLGPGRRYQFVHALIREALYEALSTQRRHELHARAARAIEEMYGTGDEQVSALSEHCFRAATADDAVRGFGYTLRAARLAARASAFHEAVAHYRRARELARLAQADEAAVLALQIGLAEAAANVGDVETVRTETRSAMDRARRLGDALAFARAAHCLAFGEHGDIPVPEIAHALEEALQRYGREDALRVRLLVRLADAKWFSAPPMVSRQLAENAVTAARAVGDADSLAHALSRAYRMQLGTAPEFERRSALAREMSEHVSHVRSSRGRLECRWHLLGDAVERGDRLVFDQRVDALLREAAESRHPFAPWYAACARTTRLHLEARFDEAEAEARRAATLAAPGSYFRDAVFGMQLQGIRLAQGRFGEYADDLRGHLRGDRPPAARAYLALADAMRGRREEAEIAFTSLVADDLAAMPRDVNWMTALLGLADLCVILGRSDDAAILEGHLLPFADHHAWLGASWFYMGSVARQLGLLAELLGRPDDAMRLVRTGLERDARMGAPACVAAGRLELAKLLRRRQERVARTEARALLRRVVADATRLGLPRLGAEAEGLLDGPG